MFRVEPHEWTNRRRTLISIAASLANHPFGLLRKSNFLNPNFWQITKWGMKHFGPWLNHHFPFPREKREVKGFQFSTKHSLILSQPLMSQTPGNYYYYYFLNQVLSQCIRSSSIIMLFECQKKIKKLKIKKKKNVTCKRNKIVKK